MTNRQTNSKNAAIATLTASMGPTDLTVTVDSTGTLPASPCYLVLSPDDDTKREVIYADGAFSGTTVAISSIANRYLDGSAAGSGLTHAIGARIIHASGLSQLWEDINDRVDAHAHTGGTDGAQVDHGGLAGLADDDHTQYLRADGTRALFSVLREAVATYGSPGATPDLDWTNGSIHSYTLTANATFTFSNVPTGGAITVLLTQDGTGSRTVTWPAAVKWAGGTAPTLSTGANDVDILSFLTLDSGTTVYGFVGGQDFG